MQDRKVEQLGYLSLSLCLGRLSGRTGYIISGPQCKMEMWASCSKIVKNAKMTAGH